ncbi:hypothetical protein TrCOL_g11175 [Triparma columacea]|uniref:RecQ-mediated genome instability protein 1 n=1 Tax=Triparma columacea TaxID=722753 RepID=A0A9W7LE27_9STRA|nr:hypothetical protein TrCOL_g11175 [Triparma columacea]
MSSKFHVHLSRAWLTSCLQTLPPPTNPPPAAGSIDEDYMYSVYMQVINSDIRDSVNGRSTTTSQLREAIQTSLSQAQESGQGSPPTPSVDENFRLMVQVDELVDVSTNAERRAERGASRTQGFSNPGYYNGRCMKIAICDGWVREGGDGGEGGEGGGEVTGGFALPVIAMEVTPIPDLSVNTLAGCKVVLKGPFPVVLGVALLHPSNVLVLGGSVDVLVAMQEQAVEAGRRTYGNGRGGATLRALVTSREEEREGEEEGVGEEESGDLEREREGGGERAIMQRQQQQRQQQHSSSGGISNPYRRPNDAPPPNMPQVPKTRSPTAQVTPVVPSQPCPPQQQHPPPQSQLNKPPLHPPPPAPPTGGGCSRFPPLPSDHGNAVQASLAKLKEMVSSPSAQSHVNGEVAYVAQAKLSGCLGVKFTRIKKVRKECRMLVSASHSVRGLEGTGTQGSGGSEGGGGGAKYMYRSFVDLVDPEGYTLTAELSNDIVEHQVGFGADHVKGVLKGGGEKEREEIRGRLGGDWPHEIRGGVRIKIVGGAEEGGESGEYKGGGRVHPMVVGWEWEKEKERGRPSAD